MRMLIDYQNMGEEFVDVLVTDGKVSYDFRMDTIFLKSLAYFLSYLKLLKSLAFYGNK